ERNPAGPNAKTRTRDSTGSPESQTRDNGKKSRRPECKNAHAGFDRQSRVADEGQRKEIPPARMQKRARGIRPAVPSRRRGTTERNPAGPNAKTRTRDSTGSPESQTRDNGKKSRRPECKNAHAGFDR